MHCHLKIKSEQHRQTSLSWLLVLSVDLLSVASGRCLFALAATDLH